MTAKFSDRNANVVSRVRPLRGARLDSSGIASSGYARFSPRIAKHLAAGALITFCLFSVPLLMREISFLPMLNEAGYGDSYILYDVLQFQKTGTIYRDLSQPPYLPAQYSPVVYIFYSLPGRLLTWENPFVGPRLLVLASFFACIGIVISIVVTLIPVRFAWVWGLLLTCSTMSMWNWVLQIRADFPGIAVGLLSIRVLMSRSRWAVPLAGICAGVAIQFKMTFVAAAAAGALWLLIRQQWKDLAKFTVLAAVSSVSPYLVYHFREPRMLSQMLALSPGVVNVTGNLKLLNDATGELVILLALLGLVPAVRRFWPRWALVIIFATTSFAVAALTGIQAGANVNYYFEALFAVIPIAVLGALRFVALAGRNVTLTFFILALFGVHFLAPRALYFYEQIIFSRQDSVGSRNDAFRKVERTLRGHRILSTVPRLALLDPAPPLVEPYLLSYLRRLGTLDPEPLLKGIRSGQYDVAITATRPQSHRGVPHVGPELHDAIAAAYKPQCTLAGAWLLHLPADPHPDTSALARDLAGIGCVPVSPAISASW